MSEQPPPTVVPKWISRTGTTCGYQQVGEMIGSWTGAHSTRYHTLATCCGRCGSMTHSELGALIRKATVRCRECYDKLKVGVPIGCQLDGTPSEAPDTLLKDRRRAQREMRKRIAARRADTEARLRRIRSGLLPTDRAAPRG